MFWYLNSEAVSSMCIACVSFLSSSCKLCNISLSTLYARNSEPGFTTNSADNIVSTNFFFESTFFFSISSPAFLSLLTTRRKEQNGISLKLPSLIPKEEVEYSEGRAIESCIECTNSIVVTRALSLISFCYLYSFQVLTAY